MGKEKKEELGKGGEEELPVAGGGGSERTECFGNEA